MRKIEQQMIDAIRAGKNWQSGNTSVTVSDIGLIEVRLHANLIAVLDHECASMRFTLAGWPTPTTRSRVNALLREFANVQGRCFAVGQQRGKQIYSTWCTSHDTDGRDIEREITVTEWVQA